ncbi:MAG TPA: MBOAT family O-acyltransferase [Gemmatimonadales bacterium]
MLFNSYGFLLAFLPLVLAGWWLLPTARARLGFLTAASWFFYAWWDLRFVPLMIVSTSADYFAGRMIATAASPGRRKLWLVLLLAFNLGLLGVFKYYDFFVGSLLGVGRMLGFDPSWPLLALVLPVGISFYTFNSISYTIDIYRGRLQPARSFLEFSTFVAMFPHLVAGPIVRYADMADQFERLAPRPRADEWVTGLWMFALGMAKKVLVADVIARGLVDPLWAGAAGLDTAEAWLAALGYTAQIYFDFSGYSDMAVGLALLLGFRFPQNFDSPYKSASIAEFWRRWHMSLSFWIRDYLFIPLGGSRGTTALVARNLLLTMLLGGLWHGAGWTFAVWGLYHGALLAGHAALSRRGWVPSSRALSVAVTFLAVVVGWVFFRSGTLAEAGRLLATMAGLREGEGGNLALVSAEAGATLLASAGIIFLARNTWEIRFPRTRLAAAALAALLVLCVLRFAEPSPFIYFQF